MSKPKLQLMKICIEHHPETGISINDKSAQEVADFIIAHSTKLDMNFYETCAMLIDILATQAAGSDYDAADGEQGALQFVAVLLGHCYNKAMLGFSEGAIETRKIDPTPESPHGAN
jgi:hypothetical protein